MADPDELREGLLRALATDTPAGLAFNYAIELRARGLTQIDLYWVFSDVLGRLEDEDPRYDTLYDALADTLDYIVGYCSPQAKLFDHYLSNEDIERSRSERGAARVSADAVALAMQELRGRMFPSPTARQYWLDPEFPEKDQEVEFDIPYVEGEPSAPHLRHAALCWARLPDLVSECRQLLHCTKEPPELFPPWNECRFHFEGFVFTDPDPDNGEALFTQDEPAGQAKWIHVQYVVQLRQGAVLAATARTH